MSRNVLGDPTLDNKYRASERSLKRTVRTVFVILSSRGRIPRKRKKYMYRVERANYRALLLAVAKHLAREKATP